MATDTTPKCQDQGTRTADARRALADAIQEDLRDVADRLTEAVDLLSSIRDHAGGINGLASRCRAALDAIGQHRDAIQGAADEYHETLTSEPARTVQITESVDDELTERVMNAREDAA
jgi:hypothetical protein